MDNFFVRRPIFAIVTSIIIVLLGFISIRSLPIEQYPNITPPVVEVSGYYLGADASTVSQSVATPLAQSVMGVENMLYMQSTSANDGSMGLSVTFDIGTNPDMNTILTQNRIASATPMLPPSVNQQGVTTQKTTSSFVMVVALSSEDGRYQGDFLSNYAVLNIQNELLKINGVGKVQVMGAGNYSMRIWIEPDKLAYLGLTAEDIAQAIESQSGIYPVGKFGAEPAPAGTAFTYTVVLPPAISTPEQYADITVRTLADGTQVRLSDVARVEFGVQSYEVSGKFRGEPAAIITIYQAPGSNALDVGNAVKDVMGKVSADMPAGMKYEVVVDTTTVIFKGIKEILMTLVIALILVILIIYLFIQDIRAMIIPVVAIPVSLIGAFMLFPLLGFTINIFSLLGLVLAIGLVVDDAIVVVEAVQVGIEKGLSPRKATIEAIKAVSPAIIATTAVLAAVFIPVSFMGGISGRLYQQFAITIALSVVISAFNALTLSPALCSIWLRPRKVKTTGFFGSFNRVFDRGVSKYLSFAGIMARRAIRSVLLIGVVVCAVVVLFNVLPGGFLPEEDQGYLMTSVSLPEAASLERTQRTVDEITAILNSRSYVAGVASASGFNMLAGTETSNSAVLFIMLTDFNKRAKADVIANELNGLLYMAVNSATAYTFGPPAIPAIGTASGFTMMLQQKGAADSKRMSEYLGKFIDEANRRPEISMASTQYSSSMPQRCLNIDRGAAFALGVDMSEVDSELATFLGGRYINNFNRFGRLYQTYIQAEADFRQSADGLSSFYVTGRNGAQVPLSAFITVSDTTGAEYLTGFNLLNSATVMGSAGKGYSSSQAMDALEEVAGKILPEDMTYSWSGMSYQERTASSGSIYAYLAALVFVFLVLAALYESWTTPFTILLGVPFALLGALLFIYLAHRVDPIYIDNIFMQISLIMLIGLSAKNAILIVQYANNLFMSGSSLMESALGAAKLRVRPILMTALAFILSILPLVFATGSNAVARNVMGLALVGGMMVATALGLLVYPALYVMIGKLGKLESKRKKNMEEES